MRTHIGGLATCQGPGHSPASNLMALTTVQIQWFWRSLLGDCQVLQTDTAPYLVLTLWFCLVV